MSNAPSFSSALDKPAGEVKPPPTYPAGSYLVLLSGAPVHGVSAQKKTPFVAFGAKFMQVMDDVSQEELAAFGGIQGKEMKPARGGLIFYITDDSAYRLKEFLTDHCGISETDEAGNEKTLRQMITEAPGKQVIVTFRHNPSEDGKRMFAEVAETRMP